MFKGATRNDCRLCDKSFVSTRQYQDHQYEKHPFFCKSHDAEFGNLEELSAHYSTKPHGICQPCAMREHYRLLKPTTSICLHGKPSGCDVDSAGQKQQVGLTMSRTIRPCPRQTEDTVSSKSKLLPLDEDTHLLTDAVNNLHIRRLTAHEDAKVECPTPSIAVHVEPAGTIDAPAFVRPFSPELLSSKKSEIGMALGGDESDNESECMPNDGHALLAVHDCQGLDDQGELI
jgi:hypothetical protein